MTSQRAYSALPDGAQDIGKMVSSASEKLGLGDNQFAAGGFQLALIGGILAGVRLLGSHALDYIKKRIVVTAEFDSRDESYSWILNWLSDHPYAKKATQFSVSTTIARGAQKINGEGGDGITATTYFLPAPGLHFFWYKNRLLWMYRERVRPSGSTVATSGGPAVENITISTLGRSRDLIQSLIMEAQSKFIDRDKARTVIFAADQYGNWRRTKSRPKRPLDTIVMDPKLKNYIVNDAKEFLASESWYAERGLPFRRGLLLYGSPGTGKTSFIHALAGELGLNIYVVNLSSKTITDDTLSELVSETPTRCLLLIEDVDAAFVQRESKDAAVGITFSGLLNSVDGVSAQEGRILCMTTNHLDRLDEALIRPGRVDVRARFGKATKSQAQELFTKFFPQPTVTTAAPLLDLKSPQSTEAESKKTLEKDKFVTNEETKPFLTEKCPPEVAGTIGGAPSGSRLTKEQTEVLAAKFAEAIPDQTYSIAQLQGFLMGYKKTPELAVQHVDEFVRRAGSADVSGTAKVDFIGDESSTSADADKENSTYWEGSEEQERERKEFRAEKERARRDSMT
ncbi:mitochondrial chaperone BCS1 [Entomortierella parvispora]|uniref:Mitochondrial chaperone BCS1 n=1 Tax=Entomortierella parvispora TaxID=205924 RepID=A0A9P3H1Y6_9FUNG|nr:mitochondrial chaperone BCS1 [Entomortierella parvispora]